MNLSICIPTFNRSSYLFRCLDSLSKIILPVGMTVEIIVVDNNSTDSTANVVQLFVSKLNLKYYRNDTNIGLCRNLLRAISCASGDYYWCIGDDDCLYQDALISLYNYHCSYPSELYICNSSFTDTSVSDLLAVPFTYSSLLKYLPQKHLFSNQQELLYSTFGNVLQFSIAFDALGAIFSVVSRVDRLKIALVVKHLDESHDPPFASLIETFPHIYLYESYFKSKTLFIPDPLLLSFRSARDWGFYWPIISSFRIPQILDFYFKHDAISLYKYYYYKSQCLTLFPYYFCKIITSRLRTLVSLSSLFTYSLFYLTSPVAMINSISYFLRKCRNFSRNKR